MPDKIDALYDALKADGAVTKSREHFREYISDDNNRRKLYEALKADGAIQSSNLTEFDNRLGYGSAKVSPSTVTAPTTAYRAKAAQPQVKAPAKASKKQSGGSRLSRTTAKAGEAPRYDVFSWAKGTMAKVKQAKREKREGSFLGRILNKAEDATKAARRQKAAQAQAQTKPKQVTAEQATADLWNTVAQGNAMMGGLHDRAEAIKEYQRQGWRDKSGRVATVGGVHSDVRKGKSRFNPETGKMEERWLTATGGEFGSAREGDLNQLWQEHPEILEKDMARRSLNEEGLAGDINRALNARAEELAEIDRKRQAVRSFGQQMIHGLANAEAGPSGGYNSEYLNDLSADPATRQLRAAKALMDDAKDIVNEADIAAKEGKYAQWLDSWSFLKGAGRGFMDKVGKVSTWDFGISDVLNGREIKNALDKFDKGKKLTKSEEMLLEALATKTAVDGYFGSELGRGYKAGGVTAEALPFMLEMAANPLSKAGGAAAKAFSKWVAKKYGVKMGSKLLGQTMKVAGRGGAKATEKAVTKGTRALLRSGEFAVTQGGNVLGATGMALTSGQGRVQADMLRRQQGEVAPVLNQETGRFEVGEHKKGEDGMTAYLDALVNTGIENYTEMMGVGVGKGFGKVRAKLFNKMGLSKVNGWIDKIGSSGLARGLDDFLTKTQWHGPIGEYFEEVAGNVLNAALVHDMEFSTAKDKGVFNLDDNIDTFLGVALMGGVFSTIKTVGYVPSRRAAKRRLDNADRMCQQQMGTDWGAISASLTGTDEQIQQVLSDVMKSTDYNQQQKQAVLNYAYALQNAKGVEVGAEKLKAEMTPEHVAEQDAEEQGYNTEDDAEMRTNKLRYDNAVEQLQQSGLDMSEVEAMANDGSIYRVLGTNTYNEAETNAVREWLMARASYNGMISRVQDDIDDEVATAQQAIEDRVAKQEQGGDGMIHPAVLKLGDRQVDIVGGNVVIHEEDGSIDTNKSDKDLLVRDTQTGKVEMVNINDLARAEAPIDAQQLLAETRANIENARANEVGDKIDGTVQVGGTYTFDFEGEPHTVTVLDDNGDGNLVVQEEGGEPYAIPKTYLQQMVDAEAMKQMEQGEGDNAQFTMQNAQSDGGNAQSTMHNAQLDAGGEASEQTPTQESEHVGEQTEEEEPEIKAHRELYSDERFDKASADELVQNNINAAKKDVSKAEAEMKKPNLETDREKYLKKLEQRRNKLATAQANLDYWTKIQEVENTRVQAEQEAAAAERAAQDEATHQQAVADEEAYQAEQLAKQQEQAERGPFTVGSNVVEKWQQSPKVEGYENEITLPNGEKITGRYMLVESGVATPSHNANHEFVKNDGFPVDENGNTVNDRDYERDKDAQEITRDTANHYDARAIQNVPVVSNDGVVLSGNGRTMAGELAAEQGTDGAYVEHLTKYGRQFGFAPEQVSAMQHPRVVFVPDEAMPYTAETFAKFNAQEMKGQNKTEQAVKLGKVVDDATFHRIINSINEFDTLGDFYADQKASVGAINELRDAGVINAMQYGEMFDGEKLSDAGRNMIENMLIGKAFESNPDAIRQLTKYKSLRQSVVNALAEISNNVGLGEDYSLEAELAEAIKLAYEARNAGRKSGEKVSAYARQMNLFAFDNGETVADYTNLTILMLADVLNDNRVNQLKKTLAMYNKEAQDNADGQMDIFSGGVKNKEDILNEILELLNYGTKEEQQAAVAEAVERRKAEAQPTGSAGVQQDGANDASRAGEQPAGGNPDVGGRGTDDAASEELEKEVEPRVGPFGEIYTQFQGKPKEAITFLLAKRSGEAIGALHHKDIGSIDLVWGEEGTGHSDGYGLAKLAKYHPEVLFDLQEILDDMVVVKRSANRVQLESDKYKASVRLTWDEKKKTWLLTMFEKKNSALDNTTDTGKTLSSNGNDTATPESTVVSVDKGSENSATVQENGEKKAENQISNAVQAALAAAERETNTEPTDAQKEAGNYKKGHVKIDGYDVTIENPKGSVRRGTDASGKEWEQEMQNTYGYIRGTEGVDGDHIDVFLSDNLDEWNGTVYVIDQVKADGSFDEHKVMYGFNSAEEAAAAYNSNYSEGWQGLGTITGVSKEEFKKWIGSSHRKTKPFAEYKNVKVKGEQAGTMRQPTGQTVDGDIAHFHKETDSSGRTAIDEANYNADDLVAPLLVDGKKSHIGITQIVPDDINEPTYTRAYYDYAHLIDPKTNKGWQAVGDKIDEWNASHKKDEQGFDDGDSPQVRFPSVDAALKFAEWFEASTSHQEQRGAGGVLPSAEEVALRDGLVDVMRNAGVDVITDDNEAQRVLSEANGRVMQMGTTTRRRQEQIGKYFDGRNLSEQQRLIVDVFSEKNAEATLSINDIKGKLRRTIFRQGQDSKAGVKHSVFRHYDTNVNNYTADEILFIPDIVNQGMRKQSGNKVSYSLDKNGITYTVTTQLKSNGEELFTNYYTNRKPTAGTSGASNTATQHAPQQSVSGAKLQKVVEPTNEEGEKIDNDTLFKAAKKKFGVTHDLREAGYILPDGTMLDFSGRHELFGADDSGIRGRRATDHRVISSVAYDYDQEGNEIDTGIETNMSDFIRRGAIRIDYNGGSINLATAPTPEQRNVLRRLIAGNDGDVYVDFGDGWDSDHYAEYSEAKPSRVLNDIEHYFRDGTKPSGNVQFFKTENGEVYGFVRDGKIYLDPKIANSETAVHEYTHLWSEALRANNAKAWERLKDELLKDKETLEVVKKLYPELEGDALMDEVFSNFSGKRGAEKKVKNIQQYYTDRRTMSIAGRGMIVEYDPELCGNIDFDLSINEAADTPIARMQNNDVLMQMFQMGAINIRQLLENGSWPFTDRLLESLKADEAAAMEQQGQMLQTQAALGEVAGALPQDTSNLSAAEKTLQYPILTPDEVQKAVSQKQREETGLVGV